jgi:hypothetical protein
MHCRAQRLIADRKRSPLWARQSLEKEDGMTLTALTRTTALATILAASITSSASAQTATVGPHYPNTTLAQATPGQGPAVQPAQPRVIPVQPDGMPAQPRIAPVQPDVTPAQPGMMCPGMMMGQGTMQPAQPGAQSAQPGMMGSMMGQGMTCPMMRSGMTDGTGAMPMMGPRGHMMKVIFAIADTNGDGGLSFEEVTAVHKRIFERVDGNKDGKVTREEIQTFMRE